MINPGKTTLDSMITSSGESLSEISMQKPVLLVFLRHFGCTFCREAMTELAAKKQVIRNEGIEIVFVHMADEETANRYFVRYNLSGFPHISDPDCRFYQEFGLVKGNFNQLFGLNIWLRGIQSSIIKGNGLGAYIGDGFQMPGVFMIQEAKIKGHFIHKYASDRPDYNHLLTCAI